MKSRCSSIASLFEVEYEGDIDDPNEDDGKFAVRRCRLLRPADPEAHQIWSGGEHAVSAGRAWAFGSATVRASGSATVEAFDSATVEASGSATVRAFGSANVIRARWHSGGWVKLEHLAAVIDRRADGTVAFHAAPWSDAPAGTENPHV